MGRSSDTGRLFNKIVKRWLVPGGEFWYDGVKVQISVDPEMGVFWWYFPATNKRIEGPTLLTCGEACKGAIDAESVEAGTLEWEPYMRWCKVDTYLREVLASGEDLPARLVIDVRVGAPREDGDAPRGAPPPPPPRRSR